MNKNMTDSLQGYLDDFIQKALQESEQQGHSFMELQEQRNKLYQRVEAVLETLPAESKQEFEDFLDVYSMISGQQNEFLYWQGIKDGILILKRLEIYKK